jgi:hypothetical protein
MTAHHLALLRLSAQHIQQADFKSPEDVVRYMGAMQAQDYAGAKWSIALRMADATTAADIERAVAERRIVRSWPQRGTIHFVAPEELRWRLQLSTDRILKSAQRRHDNLGLTSADFRLACELAYQALQGDKQLSRPDMMLVFERGGMSTVGQRGYHMLWYLAQTGHICFGPLIGKQSSFALCDDWLPRTAELSREEALEKLAHGYFMSHGPASLKDFAWWSGLTVTEARQALQLALPKLDTIVVSDTTYYMSPNLRPANTPNGYLLPGFDEYSLGYTDRSAVLAAEHAPKTVPGGNGMFRSTIVIDGQIVGTWLKSARKTRPEPVLTPFEGQAAALTTLLSSHQQRWLQYIGAA